MAKSITYMSVKGGWSHEHNGLSNKSRDLNSPFSMIWGTSHKERYPVFEDLTRMLFHPRRAKDL